MKPPAILLAIDDDALRQVLKALLLGQGYAILESSEKANVSGLIRAKHPDGIILGSSKNDAEDVLELAKEIRRLDRRIPLILIVRTSSEVLAIASLKAGVTDYFTQPLSLDELARSVRRNLLGSHLKTTSEGDDSTASGLIGGQRMIGESLAMREVRQSIRRVAATDSTVLITGETGAGKELTAEAIHTASRRRQQPFIRINCAAIPDTLLESELFGYERGAFTGAEAKREGLLKQGDGGTVFFDEIGDMSPHAQAKVLRVLDNREVSPLGGKRGVPLNIRFVAATNQDLVTLVKEGKFRQDLYFRLKVAVVHIPPLRDRKEDIPGLLWHYLQEVSARSGSRTAGFSEKALTSLLRYSWPGNVRELKNLVEALAMSTHAATVFEVGDLPELFGERCEETGKSSEPERDRLVAILTATHWNKSKAAKELHWSRMTLYRKLAKYHLKSSLRTDQTVDSISKANSEPVTTVSDDVTVL